MEETVFQKIIDRTVPADIVHETDTTLAFLDINPINKGHTLVIPKTPVPDIFSLSENDASDLMRSILVVSRSVKSVTDAPGMNISCNNGAEAGQEVFHLHFHIIPRFAKHEFEPVPRNPYANDEERRQYADAIKEHC